MTIPRLTDVGVNFSSRLSTNTMANVLAIAGTIIKLNVPVRSTPSEQLSLQTFFIGVKYGTLTSGTE